MKKRRIQFRLKNEVGETCLVRVEERNRKKVRSGWGQIIEAVVINLDYGYGVWGESVCNPNDEYDFVFGAKQALERAMKRGTRTGTRFVAYNTRKKIWKTFLKELKRYEREQKKDDIQKEAIPVGMTINA